MNGSYDAPDNLYRGIGCAHLTKCAKIANRMVFDSAVVVWSGSFADFTNVSLSGADADNDGVSATQSNLGGSNASITFHNTAGHAGNCTDGQSAQIRFPVTDGRKSSSGTLNPMPVGTTVTVTSTNGSVDSSSASFTVGDTTSAPVMTILVASDATYDTATNTCTNTSASGALSIVVTTPKQNTSTYTIAIHD